MATAVKIPFSALISGSPLVLLSVNVNTKSYDANGKVNEGVAGEPKIEVAALDSFDRFTITVKTLDSTLAKITEEQITQSLKSRRYIAIELVNGYATPYAARSGFGVSYSVKADSAKLVAQATQAGMAGVGKLKPTE